LDQIRLAYPIEGQEAAYFGYVHFNASTDAIVEISAALKLEQKVLRFLVVTPPMEKTIPRRIDFRHPVERSSESTGQAVKTEPLSNAELVEKLEEFSK
jgi:ribosomal protein S6